MLLSKIGLGLMLLITVSGSAQKLEGPPPPQQGPLDAETIKKANNPMADTKAFNLQNYAATSLYGSDAKMNQLLFRYAQPFKRFLIRATMPLVVSSQPEQSPVSGLGDFNVFGIYSLHTSGGNQFGVGPMITIPTATHQVLGSGKWQGGFSALAFFAKSHVLQLGSLLQYQISFAGDHDRDKVSLLTYQLFLIWQLSNGFYLRSTGVWSFDLNAGNYTVPLGLGVGKVIKMNDLVFNIFAEPQISVLASGIGQTRYQTFFGFNVQF